MEKRLSSMAESLDKILPLYKEVIANKLTESLLRKFLAAASKRTENVSSLVSIKHEVAKRDTPVFKKLEEYQMALYAKSKQMGQKNKSYGSGSNSFAKGTHKPHEQRNRYNDRRDDNGLQRAKEDPLA